MVKVIIAIVVVALVFFLVRFVSNNKQSAVENIEAGKSFLLANAEKEGVQTTPSGLQYLKLASGEGTVHPKATDRVKVHYHGTLTNGTVFDSSVERGQPLSFGLNQVISGWTEGLQLMVVGDKTRFFIPSNLAYGNRSTGPIPAGSVLIFDVELLGINE